MISSVFGHTCVDVRGCAASPASNNIALSCGNTVVIHNADTLRPFAKYPCKDVISCVAMSESGNYVAAAVYGSTTGIHVFVLATSTLEDALLKNDGDHNSTKEQYLTFPSSNAVGAVVHRMVFSPNAAYVVSVSGEELNTHITVWKWRTGTVVVDRRSPHFITSLTFLHKNNNAFAAAGKEMSVWNIKAMTKTCDVKVLPTKWDKPLVGMHATVDGVVGFMQNGKLVRLCPSGKKKCDKWLDAKIETGMFLCSGSGLLGIGGSSGCVRIFTEAGWNFQCNLPKHVKPDVSCVAAHFLSGARTRIFVMYSDKSYATFYIAGTTVTPAKHSHPPEQAVTAVGSLGSYTLCAGLDGHLKIVTSQSDVVQDVLVGSPVTCVHVTRKERTSWILIGDRYGNVYVYAFMADGNTSHKAAEVTAHQSDVLSVRFFEMFSDALGILSMGKDGDIHRFSFNCADSSVTRLDSVHDVGASTVICDVDARSFGCLSPDGLFRIWNGPEGATPTQLRLAITPLAVSVCSSTVLVGGAGSKIYCFKLDTGVEEGCILLKRTRLVTHMVAHQSRQLVAVVGSGFLHFVNMKTRSVMYQIQGIGEVHSAISFLHGGRFLIGTTEGMLSWWDLVSDQGLRVSQSIAARPPPMTVQQHGTSLKPLQHQPTILASMVDIPEKYTAGNLSPRVGVSDFTRHMLSSPHRNVDHTCRTSGVLMRSSLVEQSVAGKWAMPAMSYFVSMQGRFPMVSSANIREGVEVDHEDDRVMVGSPERSDEDDIPAKLQQQQQPAPATKNHVDPTTLSTTVTPPVPSLPTMTKCPSPVMSPQKGDDLSDDDTEADPTQSAVLRELQMERQLIASTAEPPPKSDADDDDEKTNQPAAITPPPEFAFQSPSTMARRDDGSDSPASAVEDLRRSLHVARSSLMHAIELYTRLANMQNPKASTEAQNDFQLFATDVANCLQSVSVSSSSLEESTTALQKRQQLQQQPVVVGVPPNEWALLMQRMERLEQGQSQLTNLLGKQK